jgi:DNA repair protein RecN (Recombination protein N)
MLLELAIRDLAVIRELRLAFEPGLNALTGETGAGKSIIIDALGAALGARVSADLVRTGASKAWVEAVFDVRDVLAREDFRALLEEAGIEPEDGLLVLARDVGAAGRSTARINGRTVPLSALAGIGRWLVDIHGQSEHLSLLRAETQLELLDRFAGTWAERLALAEKVRDYRRAWRTYSQLVTEERERAQRVDLLRFQVQEIAAARLRPGEEEALARERAILANAERLARLAHEAYGLLASGEGEGRLAAIDALRLATARLDELCQLDPERRPLATQVLEAAYALEEAARELRRYAESIEADPQRLAAVEDRLALIRQLKRKYGATVEEVLEHARQAAAELERLDTSEEDAARLRGQIEELAQEIRQRAERLSQRRRQQAAALERQVEEAMRALDMGRAEFEVAFRRSPEGSADRLGVDESGIDRVEFLIAPNAGQERRPLARIASGGETARLMLAIKSILSEVDETPTLVFDEVDVGIGGRSGQVVGERLWSLAARHQVLVISHLPQIAAFAEAHFRITKHEVDGTVETRVTRLSEEERIDELAAMLDGLPVTPASRANAEAMLERVRHLKARQAALARAPARG